MSRMVGVELENDERAALLVMARQDMRYPWEQLRYLIREEAERRGALPQPLKHNTAAQVEHATAT